MSCFRTVFTWKSECQLLPLASADRFFKCESFATRNQWVYSAEVMKIAFIGKGGSGKSTVSWLATQMLVSEGRKVLAIDADHNMDLVSLLGKQCEQLRKHWDSFVDLFPDGFQLCEKVLTIYYYYQLFLNS
mgnify:CR=1 FL=1